MKVIIIALMSADGYIATDENHRATTWANKEDKYLFRTIVKEAGNMIMGLNTFLTTAEAWPTVFNKWMPGRRLLVYTHHPEKVEPYENVEAVTEDPKALVERLGREGLESIVICGGTSIYNLFMQAGVVDELYIDMQATLLGKGVTLFNTPLDTKIELVDTKRLGDNNLLLHYKVVKS